MFGPRRSIVSTDLPWIPEGAPESLNMDRDLTFPKKKGITCSNTSLVSLVILFIVCIVATAALVYYLSSCPESGTVLKYSGVDQGVTQEDNGTTVLVLETTTQPAKTEKQETSVRLPRSVRPLAYELKIIPFLTEGNFTFKGSVVISVNVLTETNNITLHANELLIKKNLINVVKGENETIEVLKIETVKDLQFLLLHFSKKLVPGFYDIQIEFSGFLNDTLQGFYRSSYRKDGKIRWIAATQFQATDARRAFPCFDEPALKAKFTISVGRPSNMTAISNMPKYLTEPMPDLKGYEWDHFNESVPMSTYLVAFAITDFKSKTKDMVTLWAREDAINQATFSVDIAPQILKYYEQFFNISFPLPKIDMIALPDFSAGAMENWGLITFRESSLLYDESVSSRKNRQDTATIIAHELSHQWFGNLVTPSWWTDLWLNEGFASFMEYHGVDAVNPEWKLLDQFVVNELQLVFTLDALESSHPISVKVNDPSEIDEIFDRISYSKGATIIRMMQHFMTSDAFKGGLTNYLKAKEYSSADQDDLWQFLTEEAHQRGTLPKTMNIKEIMDTWTLRVGFPVVNVERNYEDNSVVLKQERFLVNISKHDEVDGKWWIPVSFIDAEANFGTVWMNAVPTKKINVNTTSGDWLLFNVNQTGYYRVNYDETNWRMLIAQLNKTYGHLVFDPKNRAQIIDDALNLANAGYLNYNIALNITTYLKNESDFVPWKAALKGLNFVVEMFSRSGKFGIFKNYLISLISPVYYKLGKRTFLREPALTTYNRYQILEIACRLELTDCISNAVREFQNWRTTPNPDKYNPIFPDNKRAIYCAAIRAGGEEEWTFAWERYLGANVGTEKDLLLSALACTRDGWLLNQYLEMAITEGSGIRKQDAGSVFAEVAKNVIGQPLAFKYLSTNWEKIKKYMGSNVILVGQIIRSVTNNFNSVQELDNLKEFAARNKDDIYLMSRQIQQSIEKTKTNIRWMELQFKTILQWLEHR